MNQLRKQLRISMILLTVISAGIANAQRAMVNVGSRNSASLNGRWKIMLDQGNIGDWKKFWIEPKTEKKTDFFEYSFDGGPELNVPGDFNSQMCELAFYEGAVWYKKKVTVFKKRNSRQFLYFGAVNYMADVYLNEEKLGSHEGGFTPFQFEVTDKLKDGDNTIIVKVDNRRLENGIPGYGYDWLNYGGITRDVKIIETQRTYIQDYFIQLKKGSLNNVQGWIQLNGEKSSQKITVRIPELNTVYRTKTNSSGYAELEFSSQFKLWSPESPKLYRVIVETETDSIADEIGFRSIETIGNEILLNKKSIFIKAVNIHEENPMKKSRAFSLDDAKLLLNSAKELGCNMVRLAHYPHNENMIREAEKMGLMVWSELPVYQHIKFDDSLVPQKMDLMLQEMIGRDRNRCAVVVWSLSNETYSGTPNRDKALIGLTKKCREIDPARLVTHVINTQGYTNNSFNVWDPLYSYSDLIAINEYIGWYIPWQGKPSEVKWKIDFSNKPVFISEFGAEALYGNRNVPADQASYWSEEYQEQIYKNQIEMFNTIPNLRGVCPWILYDYRSLGRMHPVYQKGYNRKGLISENGEKKKAWHVMNDYFKEKENEK
jgi:beta-glucuronidase